MEVYMSDNVVVSFRSLLKAGFSPEHILLETQRHVVALKNLSPDTEGRDDAIKANEDFVKEVEELIAGQNPQPKI
jgi:hypothetical protein